MAFSTTCFEKEKVGKIGKLCLSILTVTRMASIKMVDIKVDDEKTVEMVELNNLTLINFILRLTGPMGEQKLTVVLLVIQILCSFLAFTIRYPLAYLLYGEIIA